MPALADLQAAYDANAGAISGYAAALALDAVTPLESYSLDGENVTSNEWRAGLAAMIRQLTDANKDLMAAINAQTPWQISTRQVLW